MDELNEIRLLDTHLTTDVTARLSVGSDGPVRQRSLVRPERTKTIEKRKNSLKRTFMRDNTIKHTGTNHTQPQVGKKWPSVWQMYSWGVTILVPDFVLHCAGYDTATKRQAWREKIGLVAIIAMLCAVVAFLTFGLQQVLCGLNPSTRISVGNMIGPDNTLINGRVYAIDRFVHPTAPDLDHGSVLGVAGSRDSSFLFQTAGGACRAFFPAGTGMYFPCITTDPAMNSTDVSMNAAACHGTSSLRGLKLLGDQYFTWTDILKHPNRYVVYNAQVMDTRKLQFLLDGADYTQEFARIVTPGAGFLNKDISYLLGNNNNDLGRCFQQLMKVGVLDTSTIGCISSDIILYVSLIVIIGVVLAKFLMALFFNWSMGRKLGRIKSETAETRRKRIDLIEQWSSDFDRPAVTDNTARFSTHNINQITSKYASNLSIPSTVKRTSFLPQTSRFSTPLQMKLNSKKNTFNPFSSPSETDTRSLAMSCEYVTLPQLKHQTPVPPPMSFQPYEFALAHSLLLVTCYSEGSSGLRSTFDSLALTDYPNSHKLLFVVCDGLVTGSGNLESTPAVCLGMMRELIIPADQVQAHSYVAVSAGETRLNKAKVYAGYYDFDPSTVSSELHIKIPMVLVVKCGTEEEQGSAKPGNRGKRDSQIILMSFLQRIMFDERMLELDFQLFNAMWALTGVTPDSYEMVLMVDADTKVYPDSLAKMISVMVLDPLVMGLCGETKIANKSESFITAIQVFEYYISHHMSKAFESMFGGVTCLPGCFCMYRIKAPKGDGYWTPILANPDIVENYSEHIVDTLHKKNLLLLGEDRYLTTIMLKTFPKRKMVFVPEAICKTLVPNTFRILLSQRRRWINSTVHNLLELVLIRDLCGTFCFSMQFVIFMELVGTVVLPAAICFTIYLIIVSFLYKPVPIIPLTLLAAILGLPAVLILFTTRKLSYIGWMLIYLLSLPIWNLVLPCYAYWHFDDFSWGDTRIIEGDNKTHDVDGVFDSSNILMKRWEDFERDKRLLIKNFLVEYLLNKPREDDNFETHVHMFGYLSPNVIPRLAINAMNHINNPTSSNVSE